MQFIIEETYEDVSRAAADIIAEQIQSKPAAVLGLATGSTPIGTYEELVAKFKRGEVSFKDITTFNLDEYAGLNGDHDQSYRWFMNHHLFDNVDIDKVRTHVPSGNSDDPEKMCEDYEKAIEEAGGVDLQLLGLGHNGHIGFNEPCDEFPVATHYVELTQSTIEANSRLFNSIDEVPTAAYTMGIGTIMKAKKVLLLATGEGKAEIVKKAFKGEVTPQVPASILQSHPDCTIILDKEAASQL